MSCNPTSPTCQNFIFYTTMSCSELVKIALEYISISFDQWGDGYANRKPMAFTFSLDGRYDPLWQITELTKESIFEANSTIRHLGIELFRLLLSWTREFLQFLRFHYETLRKIYTHNLRSCNSLTTTLIADNRHKKLVMFYYCPRRKDLRVAFRPPCKEWTVCRVVVNIYAMHKIVTLYFYGTQALFRRSISAMWTDYFWYFNSGIILSLINISNCLLSCFWSC